MSSKKDRCRVKRILQEAKQHTLHHEQRRLRHTVYNPYLKEYVTKRIKKRRYLQTVLANDPNVNDEVWYGDSMEKAPRKHLRIWFQNSNSLIHNGDTREFQYDVANIADNGVNYMSFSETCINHSKPGYPSRIVEAYKQIIPTGHISLNNTPSYPQSSCYQPGGVAAGYDALLRTRFLKEGKDYMGRWLWHEFGQNDRRLRVYTVYRVNDGSEQSSGECTAWSQQKRQLLLKNIQSNPRKQIMMDLCKELQTVIDSGVNVIIGGDFNETITSPEGMKEAFENLGLCNVFRDRLQTTALPRTYSRGKAAVDHAWTSKYVLDNIVRAGIAPFGFLYESDHRGMFIDVDDTMLFSPEDSKIIYHDFRRLKSTVPKRIKKYMKHIDSEWDIQKIDVRYLKLLELSLMSENKNEIRFELNRLDEAVTSILTGAEKRCTIFSTHQLDTWTPELIAALKNRRHWRTKLTKAQKLPNKIGLVASIGIYKEASAKFKEADREYKSMCKDAKDARKEFLQSRAEYAAKLKNTLAEKEIKSILEVERQRNQSLRINKVMKKNHGGGPNSILIPSINEYPRPHNKFFDHMNIDQIWERIEMHNGEDIENWDRVTDQRMVENMLLRWQQKHFAQATETPFSDAKWKEQFQDKQIQEALLDGSYPIPTDLPIEAQELLREIRKPSHAIGEIRSYTTFEDFKEYISRIDEKKSSSPSGRHYGHYKTILQNNPSYLKVIHGIAEIALQHNVIIERWKKTVTSLIEKKPGTPFIHKFRVLHIIEGDLQFLARFFYSYKMMAYAEKNGLITDEQYGGRNRRMAQSVVLNKLMYYNISHQTLTPCAFMDDDARACYDRIVTCLSSTDCRKWGIGHTVANFTNEFIESQKFHVRSAFGVSKDSYKYSEEYPIEGSGQGISWAGPRWTATSTAISNVMQRTNTGMSFSDPSGNINISKCGDFFVDDTATGVSANNIQDGGTLLEHIQKDEQKHAFLLFAAGHLLALFKCVFYMYKFKRVGTKFKHTKNEEMPGILQLQSKYDGEVEEIKRLQPNEAHKTLGCYISADMSQEKQYDVIKLAMEEWIQKIRSSPLSQEDRLHAYKTILEKKLLYVLPTCSFTYKQCAELDKILSPVLFNINGVQRNCNRNVLYTSRELGGLHIYSMYHLQGVSKLQFLFMHYRNDDTTGRLMKMSMRYTQLESGLSRPYYTYNFYKAYYLTTPTWITNLWQYCSECHVQIKETDPWIYKPPRVGDFFLMDIVQRANLTKEHKEIFNRVRMNLRLLTASDIVCAGDRTRIIPHILKGTNTRQSSLNWPNVMEIPPQWIDIFYNIVINVIQPQLQSTPLGEWIYDGHQSFDTFSSDQHQIPIHKSDFDKLNDDVKKNFML